MDRARDRRPQPTRLGARAAAVIGAALLGLLPACSADEGANRSRRNARTIGTARPAQPRTSTARQRTTDRGSRFVQFDAPLGAQTVETPPLRVRRRR